MPSIYNQWNVAKAMLGWWLFYLQRVGPFQLNLCEIKMAGTESLSHIVSRVLPRKAKMLYLLTLQVSRYRLLTFDVTRWLLWSCRLRRGASCLHGNSGNKTNLVVFSALKLFFLCFCILFGISRLYSFICSDLSKLTKLKSLIPRSSFKFSRLYNFI